MALPVRTQALYWSIAAAVFFLVLWMLGGVILPFVLGGAVAYLLDPIADRFERLGLSRTVSTILVTLILFLIFALLLLLVIPTLVTQVRELVVAVPDLIQGLQSYIYGRFPALVSEDSPVRDTITNFSDTIRERAGEILNTALSSAAVFVNALVLLVLVPVIAFYLLLDWDRMVARIDALLPREHAPTIRRLAREIDDTLASFVRGQGTVCLILGTYYAIALAVIGLNFGLVVGFFAGMISFIPYVGAVLGGALAVGLALAQFWGEWWWIVAVAAIFQIGQLVEGNVLTPKLVGDSVGLHPVWLIFALSAFGALFGFLGLLVAVPVSAALGVIVRFLIAKYRESSLYSGRPGEPAQRPQGDPPV